MVGVSGIIGGAPVRGMADVCLATIGVQTSAAAVAAHYGADLIDGWLVDEQDKAAADDPALAGIAVRALPLYMRDLPSAAAIAQGAIDLALELRAMTAGRGTRSDISGVSGIPEIASGDDLARLIADAALAAGGPGLRDGDILVVTSKVVSKAEGRVVSATREDAIAAETVRVVARRGADDDRADQARVRARRRRGGRVQHRARHGGAASRGP